MSASCPLLGGEADSICSVFGLTRFQKFKPLTILRDQLYVSYREARWTRYALPEFFYTDLIYPDIAKSYWTALEHRSSVRVSEARR